MNTQSSHKIIKNKLGLLNLAQTLGSVSKACMICPRFDGHLLT